MQIPPRTAARLTAPAAAGPRRALWLGAAVTALALTACGERDPDAALPPAAPANPYAEAEEQHFTCGDLEVSARFIEGRARLVADSQTIDLIRVEAASGERFEAAGDPLTVFWSQNGQAALTISGEAYPECERVSGD
ncbi:MAG: MliC family protein [Oceanicaulis sp.]|nr:MliC family protein [Oceanicaulis sp.]